MRVRLAIQQWHYRSGRSGSPEIFEAGILKSGGVGEASRSPCRPDWSGNDTVTDFSVGYNSLVLNDGITISSLQASGSDTLVNFSNGSVMTLQNVAVTSVDQLLTPRPELTNCYTTSDSGILA